MSGKPWTEDELALLEWMARENKSPRKHQSKFPNRSFDYSLDLEFRYSLRVLRDFPPLITPGLGNGSPNG